MSEPSQNNPEEPMLANSKQAWQNYQRSILLLILMMSMFLVITMGFIITLLIRADAQGQLIIDCVDRHRVSSDCQTFGQEKTNSAVSVLKDITEAYVLCADRLDGDAAIKRCVSLKLTPPAQR